jgi:hypothetical protein
MRHLPVLAAALGALFSAPPSYAQTPGQSIESVAIIASGSLSWGGVSLPTQTISIIGGDTATSAYDLSGNVQNLNQSFALPGKGAPVFNLSVSKAATAASGMPGSGGGASTASASLAIGSETLTLTVPGSGKPLFSVTFSNGKFSVSGDTSSPPIGSVTTDSVVLSGTAFGRTFSSGGGAGANTVLFSGNGLTVTANAQAALQEGSIFVSPVTISVNNVMVGGKPLSGTIFLGVAAID